MIKFASFPRLGYICMIWLPFPFMKPDKKTPLIKTLLHSQLAYCSVFSIRVDRNWSRYPSKHYEYFVMIHLLDLTSRQGKFSVTLQEQVSNYCNGNL